MAYANPDSFRPPATLRAIIQIKHDERLPNLRTL